MRQRQKESPRRGRKGNFMNTFKSDSETVRERGIYVRMSENDCIELLRIAACNGMTPGELVGAFIGDLVGGTYTNGSDERMKAAEWLDRCCFDMIRGKTFTGYLAGRYELRDAVCNLEELDQLREDIKTEDPERAAETAKLITAYEDELKTMYREYTERTEDPAETEEEAMNGLRQYLEESERLLYYSRY